MNDDCKHKPRKLTLRTIFCEKCGKEISVKFIPIIIFLSALIALQINNILERTSAKDIFLFLNLIISPFVFLSLCALGIFVSIKLFGYRVINKK